MHFSAHHSMVTLDIRKWSWWKKDLIVFSKIWVPVRDNISHISPQLAMLYAWCVHARYHSKGTLREQTRTANSSKHINSFQTA